MNDLVYVSTYHFLSTLSLFYVISLFFELKIKKTHFALVGMVVVIVSIAVERIFPKLFFHHMIASVCFIAGAFIFLCKGQGTKKLLYALLYISIQDLLLQIFYLILYLLKIESEIGYQMMNILALILTIIIIIYISKKWRITETKSISNMAVFFFLILVLGVMGSLEILVASQGDELLSLGINLISLAIVLYSYGFIYIQSKNLHNNKRRKALEDKIKVDSNYYRMVEEYNLRTIKLKHDLKNILMELYKLEEGEREQFLKKMISSMDERDENLYTRNRLVNFLLNEKLTSLEILPKHRDIHIDIPGDLPLEKGDLGILLGNLLDNTREALDQLPMEERKLYLRINKEGFVLRIDIENTFLKIKDDLETIKMDKEEHGLGLASIEEIVKKYNGLEEIKVENNLFKIRILIVIFDEL